MKNKCLWGAIALLASAGVANAAHVSTFAITQTDFSITGFADGPGSPLVTNFTNMVGTYNMDIPTSGVWNVVVDMTYTFDFDKDGVTDAAFATGGVDLGNFTTPGASTIFVGSGLLPDMAVALPAPAPAFTLSGANLALDVDFDNTALPSGSFGTLAHAFFTLSGGNLDILNGLFTAMDNASGGGDGIIDGWATVDSTVTLTAVPIPMAALAALPMLAFGGVAARRRKN